MRKAAIVALLGLNLSLLAWVLTINITSAQAQRTVPPDYLMVSGKIARDSQAMYVLDLKNQVLKGWYYDVNKKGLVEIRGRNLAEDFKR